MKLKDIVRAVQEELPITMRMEAWLADNPNPRYSQAAIDHAMRVFSGEIGGNRSRKQPFRSSSVGMCKRKRLFSAMGLPGITTIDAKLGNIFGTGNFLHLKWQMAGLTEGWLAEAEIPADLPSMHFGGTLDGILFDGSGFEFKTINSNGFSSVMTYGPKEMHVRQIHSYMLIRPDISEFSLVYEDKDTGYWREFRIAKNAQIMDELTEEIGILMSHYDTHSLPKMLPKCETKEGQEFRGCAFREVCHTIKKWPEQ